MHQFSVLIFLFCKIWKPGLTRNNNGESKTGAGQETQHGNSEREAKEEVISDDSVLSLSGLSYSRRFKLSATFR
jgi:hypothetical protein